MRNVSNPSLQPVARASVMGAVFCFFLISGAILFGTRNYFAFFSLEGLLIVVGGVIAVAFMSYRSADVHKALHAIRLMFREPPATHETLHHDVLRIIDWARLVRKKGMLGLEADISRSVRNDPFVRYGLNMVISQYTPEEVRAMMETAADACDERDSVPIDILQSMASHAPAFGMVGTLVGMVIMLCNLTENVSAIGSSLAVSFLSTLYGVVTARMIYIPAAANLQQKIDGLRFRNHLITEGMVMLVSDKSPSYVQDRLNSFLQLEDRDATGVTTQNAGQNTGVSRLKAITT